MLTYQEYCANELKLGNTEKARALQNAALNNYEKVPFVELMATLKPKLDQGLPAWIVSGEYGKGLQLLAFQAKRPEFIFKLWALVEMGYTYQVFNFIVETMVRDDDLRALYTSVIESLESVYAEETTAHQANLKGK
jgi:hypothetical protein